MHINGCHIVSKLDKDSEEGFSSTVSRTLVIVSKDADGKDVSTESVVSKGPFATIKSAVTYAHSWSDAANPPEIPADPVPVVSAPEEVTPVVVQPVPEQLATVVHEAS